MGGKSLLKMGSEFSLFIATSLAVIKKYPSLIGSNRKRCEMLPSSSPIILYHHILFVVDTLETIRKCTSNVVPSRIWWIFFVRGPLLTCSTWVSNLFGVVRGAQIHKIGLDMGMTIGRDAVKSGKNTHLLVIMPAGILQKIGLTDLMNRTWLREETARNNLRKVWSITG